MSNLYQHQIEGAAWLAARSRGYLGDVPGLGKTRTVIEALSRAYGFRDGRPLIVCPAIVRTHWQREFAAMGFGQAPWTIKSYDEIVRGGDKLMWYLLGERAVDALILDEAHYVKHATSKRAQILLGKNGYARRLPRVYAASGTPVSKNPLEFGTILLSLFPQVALAHGIKTLQDVRDRFCVIEPRYVRGKMIDKILPVIRNEEEFKEILGAVMLRRTLDDVGIDVPEMDWQVVRLDGTEGVDQFDGFAAHDRGWVNGALSNLEHGATPADIANDPHVARLRRRLGELKVGPVAEMLSQQLDDSDEKVVVFAHHRTVLEGIVKVLGRDFEIAYIDGDTPQKTRDLAIDRFQTDPTCRVFIGQNIACQTGITLTAARRVVLVEPDWTADVNLQLGKRIARIGQRAERCVGQMIALAGTLDEGIVAHNQREVRLAETLGLGEK